jgi:diguanylate cyclase (GGDEF)-like protein
MPSSGFHYPSVAFAGFVTSVFALLVLLAVVPGFPGNQRRSLLVWTTAFAVVSISNVLFAYPQLLPAVLQLPAAFGVGMLGYLGIIYAINQAHDRPTRFGASVAVGLLVLVIISFWRDHLATPVAMSLAVAFWFAHATLAARDGNPLRGARAVIAAVFGVGAGIMFARGLLYLTVSLTGPFDARRAVMLIFINAITPLSSLGFLLLLNERLQLQLQKIADIDSLTSAATRRALMMDLDRRCKLPTNDADGVIGLLMIDIDHFKRINDEYGHDAGDSVLKRVAAAIAATIEPGAMLGRVGGEEFAVLLLPAGAEQHRLIGEKIRLAVSDLVAPMTVSIGVASRRFDESPEALFKQADVALYQAKREGRNRVMVAAL